MKNTIIALGLAATAVFGTASATIAADGLLKTIADGKAWNGKGDGTPAMKLTLNPNGTGKMKAGIMGFNLKWTANGPDGLCMSGGPLKNACMVFTPVAKGYVGKGGDGKSLTLTRG
ncbi:MAG: hypothetical protein ACRCT6_06365 [Notoacmeibacter sp.]